MKGSLEPHRGRDPQIENHRLKLSPAVLKDNPRQSIYSKKLLAFITCLIRPTTQSYFNYCGSISGIILDHLLGFNETYPSILHVVFVVVLSNHLRYQSSSLKPDCEVPGASNSSEYVFGL